MSHPMNWDFKTIQYYIENQQKLNSIVSFKGKTSSTTTITELLKPYLNPEAQSMLYKLIEENEKEDISSSDWLVQDVSHRIISEDSFDRKSTGSPALYGPDDTFLHILCAGTPSPSGMNKLLHYYFTLEQEEHQKECGNSKVENWSIVSHQNKAGATPLHVAVVRSADPHIIRYLLGYRKVYYRSHRLQKDPSFYDSLSDEKEIKDGKTFIPLSSISMNCKSLPLHLLFSNKIHYHRAIKTAILLLQDYPDALWSLNINDETPLHLMWQNYFSDISSWTYLLSRQYRFFTDGDNLGAADLQAVRSRVWAKIRYLLEIVLQDGQRKIEISPNKDTLSESLSSTSNIQTSSTRNSSNSRDTSSATTPQCTKLNTPCNVIDILISKIPRCPPVFVDAALSEIDDENHQELLEYLHQFDRNGKLILHCASEIEHWKYGSHLFGEKNTGPYCILKVTPRFDKDNSYIGSTFSNSTSSPLVTTNVSDSETNSIQSSSSYNNDNKNVSVTMSSLPQLPSQDDEGFYYFRKDCIIDHLLHLAPDTASIPTKNNTKINGQLPLHLALSSGKEWEEGVRALVRLHPDGVRKKDPLTGLYPFMLAALSNDCCSEMKLSKNVNHGGTISNMPRPEHAREDCEWVFTIYSLLRECPEVLNSHYLQLYAGTKRKHCEINDSEYNE